MEKNKIEEYEDLVVVFTFHTKRNNNSFWLIWLQLLSIMSTILLRNPELSFQKQLDLNQLVED